MSSKEFMLHLIQNSLNDLGYSEVSDQLVREIKSKEVIPASDANDKESKKITYINWFNSELRTGNYTSILSHLMPSLQTLEGDISADNNGEYILEASDTDILELLNIGSGKEGIVLVVIYLIKRTFFLESLIVYSLQTSGQLTGDIAKASTITNTNLIEYLRDELTPILDNLAKISRSLDEFSDIFDSKVLDNLTREKESNILLPLVMQSPLNEYDLVDSLFSESVLFEQINLNEVNSSSLINTLRNLLVNYYLSAIFKADIQIKYDRNYEMPPNFLEKLIEYATIYQKQQSPYYLSPRLTSKRNTDSFFLPFEKKINDIYKPKFPVSLLHTLTDHIDEVWFTRFSPSGRYLVTGSLDGKLIIYDVSNDFKVLKTLESNSTLDNQEFTPFSNKPPPNKSKAIIYCCWDPSEQYLVSCCLDTIVRVWSVGDLDKSSKRITRSMDSSVDESSKLISCFTLGQNIRTWTCEFLPDVSSGKPQFIVGSPDKVLKAYDIDGVELFDFYGNTEDDIDDERMKDEDEDDDEEKKKEEDNESNEKMKNDDKSVKKKLQNNFNRINDLSITPNGKILVTANNDRQIHFYKIPDLLNETSTTTKLATINVSGRLTSCSISANGNYLLVSIAPEELQLWDISKLSKSFEKPILYKRLIGHSQGSYIVRSAFGYLVGDEEELVLSGSDDGYIYFWKLQTGQLITRVKGHDGLCNSVDWNRFFQLRKNVNDYGKIWCSVGDDNLVKIWGPPAWDE